VAADGAPPGEDAREEDGGGDAERDVQVVMVAIGLSG
jgi:hypothetical protein